MVRSPTILPLFPRVSLRKLVSTTKNAVYLKVKHKRDHYTFLGKLPTYPSPKPTLTLTSHLGQNVGLGEGQVGSFPETYKTVCRKAKLTLSTIALIVGILFQYKTFLHRIDIEPPLKVKLKETIRNDDFQRITVLQHCYIVSNGCNTVPTLQRCVLLKIVVANRQDEHHLKMTATLVRIMA